jgi:hypothetical protein
MYLLIQAARQNKLKFRHSNTKKTSSLVVNALLLLCCASPCGFGCSSHLSCCLLRTQSIGITEIKNARTLFKRLNTSDKNCMTIDTFLSSSEYRLRISSLEGLSQREPEHERDQCRVDCHLIIKNRKSLSHQ